LRPARWPGGWLAGGFCASGRYPRIVREKEVVGGKRRTKTHQVEASALAGRVACASGRYPRIARDEKMVGEKQGTKTYQVESSALAGRVACGWLALAGVAPELFGRKK
jgi:hypothetical protein